MWDPYAEFESTTLANGLTIHAAHWPGRPWEAMGFLVHSGAEQDRVGREGTAHFVEHLVSQNTILPSRKIYEFFEDLGGSVNLGSTNYPFTLYRFFAPADEAVLAEAFSIFGHMLLSATLEQFVERERQVIIGEFHRAYPIKFRFDLDMRKNKVIYPGYWLERFVRPLGNPDSVGRISQSDLQTHYDAHYTPANMSVVGVGGMKLEELTKLLERSPFATSKKGVRTPLPAPAVNFGPLSETRHVFEISKHVQMEVLPEIGSYKSIAKIPGTANQNAVRILKHMLDEILLEEVRERRAWTYAINSAWGNLRHFYDFSITCDALALQAIGDIEGVVERCIASMSGQRDLFEQMKRQLIAAKRLTDETSGAVCSGALFELSSYNRIISLAEDIRSLEEVTMDDLRDLLAWIRPENRWTLIMKP